ncbi:MAG TPA: hypothetical protein VKR24_00605 [Candidatus Limnocylindrales bacterium]|nr:hypothetical protein [Candidatus Limnocylindrales bacterium]
MERHSTPRTGVAAAVAAVVLLAGCGSSAPAGPVFGGDPCSLITMAELQAAIGDANVAESPESSTESSTSSGCAWTLDSPNNPVPDNANLTIVSPGGAADFASTRAFLEALQGPSPSVAPSVPSTVAPAGSANPSANPSSEPDLGISLQNVPGLGDDAFIGAAGTVYTIKGDTELELQLIAFDDPNVIQHTIDLLKKAVARLP